jgi:glycosidase
VKNLNPDAYLIGEIWWSQAPDQLADPNPWLGPVFDAVMNYRWYPPSRSFLNGAPMFAGENPRLTIVPAPSQLAAHLDSLVSSVPPDNAKAMMNTAATHDAPRLSSSIYNMNGYKQGANPQNNRSYKVERPDEAAFARVRMLLALQFAYLGAPHIWNGDELGMWGGDDPDNRKPVIWPDYDFDDEAASPFGQDRRPDPVEVDTSLLGYYKRLIAVRKSHADIFVDGDLTFPLADDNSGVLVMSRRLGSDIVLVALNRSPSEVEVSIPISLPDGTSTTFRSLLSDTTAINTDDGNLTLHLDPVSALMMTNRMSSIGL